MKAWLKGGLIGLVIFIVSVFISFLPIKFLIDIINPSEGCYMDTEGFGMICPISNINYIITLIVSLIVYVLIGVFIGLFIQKIKSRK